MRELQHHMHMIDVRGQNNERTNVGIMSSGTVALHCKQNPNLVCFHYTLLFMLRTAWKLSKNKINDHDMSAKSDSNIHTHTHSYIYWTIALYDAVQCSAATKRKYAMCYDIYHMRCLKFWCVCMSTRTFLRRTGHFSHLHARTR